MNLFTRAAWKGLLAGAAMSALFVTSLASAEESVKTFENDKAGIKCTRPEDPSWKFIPEDEWSKLYSDPRDADSLALYLMKMKTAESKPGEDNAQVHVLVRYWDADTRFDFNGKIVEATSIKQFGKAMFKAFQDGFKDIKDEKELAAIKTPFDSKSVGFSFRGVDKKYGAVEWIRAVFFKENRKTYGLYVIIPSGDEKVFAKDLDTIMKSIKLYEKK